VNAGFLAELLRSPAAAASRCHEDEGLRDLVASCLVAIGLGGVAFGAAVGSFRGGTQILFAGLKLPLAALAALAVCGPAFHALAATLGRPWSLRSTLALVLASGARSALVLLALSPVLWLTIDFGASYHAVKLFASFCYGAAGISALGVLVRGLGPGSGRVATALAFVGVFLLVGGQTAWLLRPYLGDPSEERVPFLVNRAEGGVAGALLKSGALLLDYDRERR
jgi:hypothetical protein